MSNDDRRELRPFFLTPQEVAAIRKLAEQLEYLDQIRRRGLGFRDGTLPGAKDAEEPCQNTTVIQICDAKIVFEEKTSTLWEPISGCFMKPALRLSGGSSFCLCNDTDWNIRVQFLTEGSGAPCPRVEASGDPIEIESGAAAQFHITKDGGSAACNAKIWRWIDGAWVECPAGSGGGPDLEVEDPSG